MNEHHITITGLFEPVAIALSTLRSVSVVETTESHVLAALPTGTGVLAQATDGGTAVRLTLVGADAEGPAARLAADLRRLLDYDISGPHSSADAVDQLDGANYAAASSASVSSATNASS